MKKLTYLEHYSENIQNQVMDIINQNKLTSLLLSRYPKPHDFRTDKTLYQYTIALKNRYLSNAQQINRVSYDNKIHVINHALGLHVAISRQHGGKLKAKAEIKIANVFKTMPEPMLRMIVVHELAHLKEKEHNKAFYHLCGHIEPNYHQLEFDTRLYLTHLELVGGLYQPD